MFLIAKIWNSRVEKCSLETSLGVFEVLPRISTAATQQTPKAPPKTCGLSSDQSINEIKAENEVKIIYRGQALAER